MILSLPQAKSLHDGVRCSHSAHLTQPCCDFGYNVSMRVEEYKKKFQRPVCNILKDEARGGVQPKDNDSTFKMGVLDCKIPHFVYYKDTKSIQ